MYKHRIPYMGSKNKIVGKIFDTINADIKNELPLFANNVVNTIYDVFCGGGSVGYYFAEKGWNVYMNDIKRPLIDLHNVLQLPKTKTPLTEELLYKWISREEFFELKDRQDWYGELIRICWSFGNNGNGYVFSNDKQDIRRIIHNIIVYQCEDSLNCFNKKFMFLNLQMPVGNNIHTRYASWKKQIHDFRRQKYQIKDARAMAPIITKMKHCSNLTLREALNTKYIKSRLPQKQHKKTQEHLNNLLNTINDNKNISLQECFNDLRLFNDIVILVNINNLKTFQNIQQSNIKELFFTSKNYYELNFKDNCIIYADPPYINTQSYNKQTFDFNRFDNWVCEMKHKGVRVYISEYTNHNNEWREVASFNKHTLFNSSRESRKIKQEKVFCNI